MCSNTVTTVGKAIGSGCIDHVWQARNALGKTWIVLGGFVPDLVGQRGGIDIVFPRNIIDVSVVEVADDCHFFLGVKEGFVRAECCSVRGQALLHPFA